MRLEHNKIIDFVARFCIYSMLSSLLTACAPTITNIEPSAGAPGDEILITGGKLTIGTNNPSSVDFNGKTAKFKTVGNNVKAQVPQGASTGRIHVITNYFNFYSPGGTATSPFDFTVINSSFTEKEQNDTRKSANNANLTQIIKGSTTDSDQADWFKISSGSSGPWGYGLEIVVEPDNLPNGVSLRMDMEGYRADLNAIGNLTTYTDDKAFTLWTAHAPNTDIFLNVHRTGSISTSFKADYTVKISRIKINDINESDNGFNTANSIIMMDGIGSHNTSYLCNIFKNGDELGMKDFYSFNPGGATQISIVVTTPPLNQKDGVHVDLYDNTKGYRGGDAGNYVVANYNLKLPKGEKAKGTWFIEVTNAWDQYAIAGAGPKDKIPLSCKVPYTIAVIAK
ncbi:MAG: hypothetical protein KZQ95_10195 [Candidatus Thiodiazotropha sp. (ex Epidulcina cf. delphinae)]|nr:hypothetical protein [Candidatus Thiodiazotropha sp. (ex Epidulcina cf. delphinae)]